MNRLSSFAAGMALLSSLALPGCAARGTSEVRMDKDGAFWTTAENGQQQKAGSTLAPEVIVMPDGRRFLRINPERSELLKNIHPTPHLQTLQIRAFGANYAPER